MNNRAFEFEFEVSGPTALFSEPITRVGGEKFSYSVPTYEALKGIAKSIYSKPTFVIYIDAVRIMNPIRQISKGIRVPHYFDDGNDVSSYTYLQDVRYQVQGHAEWNENQINLVKDRNRGKHDHNMQKAIRRGGRFDVFLGTRECPGYVVPCRFGEGASYYDQCNVDMPLGVMFHSFTYPSEAVLPEDKGKLTTRFSSVVMKASENGIGGIIRYKKPEEIKNRRVVREEKFRLFPDRYAPDYDGGAGEYI